MKSKFLQALANLFNSRCRSTLLQLLTTRTWYGRGSEAIEPRFRSLLHAPAADECSVMLIRALLRPYADGVRVHVDDVVKAIDCTAELDAISDTAKRTPVNF